MANIFQTLTKPGPAGRPSSSVLIVGMTEIVDGTYAVDLLAAKIGWVDALKDELEAVATALRNGITNMITERASWWIDSGVAPDRAVILATEHVRAFIFARVSQVVWRCEHYASLEVEQADDPLLLTEAEFYTAFFTSAPA